jgi:hypothetical protein
MDLLFFWARNAIDCHVCIIEEGNKYLLNEKTATWYEIMKNDSEFYYISILNKQFH